MNKLRLAVIGDPIGHTLSPLIQGKLMERLGVEGEYLACHVLPEEVGDFAAKAREELSGFNITIPHKSRILPFLDEVDPYAARCGAVNTVRVEKGRLLGYNTDGDGIRSALELMGVSFRGAKVGLLGAGGAALSICRKAVEEGAEKVTVFCRRPEKAAALAKEKEVAIKPFSDLFKEETGREWEVLINATPLGMSGIGEDFTDFSFLEGFSGALCDIVYKPARTSLLKECQKRRIRCCNGLPMLIYQAIYAFEHFSGLSFNRREMGDYLTHEVEKALGGEGQP